MIGLNEILNEDCRTGLKQLPGGSVNCCVTSPPYYGLRDYGNENQIGLEETPEKFISKLVEVFREVKRVLKDDGTLWLNIGDSYWGGGRGDINFRKGEYNELWESQNRAKPKWRHESIKPKDLIGIPWMLAFALRADGWYLRQDIIWHKPNPMPESVTDRCTKSHEYIFLLSKSNRYYFDAEAIKEDAINPNQERKDKKDRKRFPTDKINGIRNRKDSYYEKANKRSVWSVVTSPFKEAHFATFPEDLIVDCIKAGCPEGGIVLDPFMGAGTTALVARKLNRNFAGFELNSSYIGIAEKRLQQELGMFV